MEAVAVEKSEYEIERDKPMPSINHAFIQKRLLVRLDIAYEEKYTILPEVNVDVIDKTQIPDLAICQPFPFRAGEDAKHLAEPPVGVIEILSPKQLLSDLVQKSTVYFKIGVRSYWLVLPDLRSIYVFHNPKKFRVFTWEDELQDDVLKIKLDLGIIFKE